MTAEWQGLFGSSGKNSSGGDGAAPAACPYCGARGVRTAGYDAPLRILRQRKWYYCSRCGWEAEADQYARVAAGGVRGG